MSAPGSFNSQGFSQMVMTIEEVTNGFAYGTDNYSRPVKVPVGLVPMKGPAPQAGETWIISKQSTGAWTLVAITNNPDPPMVVGTSTDPLVMALVQALDAAGHINFINTALTANISATSEVSA